MSEPATHPFDRAVALQPSTQHRGLFSGATSPDYWNMVGPFGGMTAAIMLQAVLKHPDLLGSPIAITVNYAAAIEAGAFEVLATPVRTNRSTQHWTLQLTQTGADGLVQVAATGTVVTALRRETWGVSDVAMPEVAPAAALEPMKFGVKDVAWVKQYEMRPAHGHLPTTWDGSGDHSESLLWLRDATPRPLDLAGLVAMTDIFYPRVWLRRAKPVPVGTVSITTYLHTDAAQLAEVGSGHLLGFAQGQAFRNGFFDQTAHLWSESGILLATSNQIVYYKE